MLEGLPEKVPDRIDDRFIHQLASGCASSVGVINEGFMEKMLEITQEIESEKKAQAIPQYSVDDYRFVFHSALLAAICHQGMERKSGGDVFKEHLHGAALELVRMLGRTKASIMATAYMHDMREDTPVGSFEAFKIAWKFTFADQSDPFIRTSARDCQRTWNIVTGLTKVVASDDVPEDEAKLITQGGTLRRLLESIIELGFDVVYVKAGDRLHNMRTLQFQPKSSQERIATETYGVYAAFLDVLGAKDYVREIVDLCAVVLNPTLLNNFHDERERRINAILKRMIPINYPDISDDDAAVRQVLGVKGFIQNMFAVDEGSPDATIANSVLAVEVVPAELGDLVLKVDKPLANMTVKDLPISNRTPLFEVLVTVKPETDVNAVIGFIKKKWLKPGEHFEEVAPDPHALVNRGRQLTIYSQGFGATRGFGVLNFRVNDSVSEARAKRGEIPFANNRGLGRNENVPNYLRLAIERIVSETRDDVQRVLPLMRDLMLCPRITVYTPEHDRYVLPHGSTPFDFADAVSGKLLMALQGVIWHKSQYEAVRISEFDPIEDGMVLEICSEPEDGGEPKELNTRALYACVTESARRTLARKVLGKKPLEERIKQVREYLKDIAKIYGVSEKNMLQLAVQGYLRMKENERKHRAAEQRMKEAQEIERLKSRQRKTGKKVPYAGIIGHISLSTGFPSTSRVQTGASTVPTPTPKNSLTSSERRSLRKVPTWKRLVRHITTPQFLARLQNIRARLRAGRKAELQQNTLSRVWCGEIDLLDILARERFKDKQVWQLRLMLPNKEGVLDQITGELRSAKVNLNRIVQIPQPEGYHHIVRIALEDRTHAKSPFEMLKLVLKLSSKYGYDIRLQPDSAIARFPGMIKEYFKLFFGRGKKKESSTKTDLSTNA